MYDPFTREQLDQLYESTEGLVNKALCAGLKALMISGYDKMAQADSVVLAAYITQYCQTVRSGMEV